MGCFSLGEVSINGRVSEATVIRFRADWRVNDRGKFSEDVPEDSWTRYPRTHQERHYVASLWTKSEQSKRRK